MPPITEFSGFLLRMVIAAALGALIGTERQLTRHLAGILTNVIVSLGSFAFCSFPYLLGAEADYTRVAAQVVSGIGFLGAGVIISDGRKVKGINTAATVWASAAVGILCTLDKIRYAVAIAIMILLSHLLLHPISEFINKQLDYDKSTNYKESFYSISVVCSEDDADEVKEKLIQRIKSLDGILLRKLETADLDDSNVKVRAEVSTKNKNNELIEGIVAHIAKSKNIISTGWKRVEN